MIDQTMLARKISNKTTIPISYIKRELRHKKRNIKDEKLLKALERAKTPFQVFYEVDRYLQDGRPKEIERRDAVRKFFSRFYNSEKITSIHNLLKQIPKEFHDDLLEILGIMERFALNKLIHFWESKLPLPVE